MKIEPASRAAGRRSTVSLDDTTIRTADVLGSVLKDAGGHKLGTIREIFFEARTGQAEFVILELSSVFGSGKFHPVPWSALRFHGDTKAYSTDLTNDILKGSPAYDRDQLADAGYAWGEQARRYFAEWIAYTPPA
jgi:hypothetical protein